MEKNKIELTPKGIEKILQIQSQPKTQTENLQEFILKVNSVKSL